jgi:hypothetical protein|tara:strand:- start:2493 stop:8855 length:6363 start_codon:yes stop_codon:yes gene_type:complete
VGWNPWDAVASFGKGVGTLTAKVPGYALNTLKQAGRDTKNFAFGPANITRAAGGVAFTGLNFFTDMVQEATGHDDEWDGIGNVIWGSWEDNILGANAVIDEETGEIQNAGMLPQYLIGPEGVIGSAVKMVPEFVRHPFRGPLGHAMHGVDWTYRKVWEEGVGTAMVVAQLAARGGENPLDLESTLAVGPGMFFEYGTEIDWGTVIDTRTWARAHEMVTDKGGGGGLDHWTWGQANTFGLLNVDITDPTQVAVAEESALFKIISGAYDLFGVFLADPSRGAKPFFAGVRFIRGGKAMTHVYASSVELRTLSGGKLRGGYSTTPIADDLVKSGTPGGDVGLFGPQGIVGPNGGPIKGRLAQSPKDFVETNRRYNQVIDIVEEHAAALDFSPTYRTGYGGVALNLDGADAVLINQLTGRIIADRRISQIAGFTPEYARALALSPNTATRNFITRLAMGDQQARRLVESSVVRWADDMQSTGAFDEITKLERDLAAQEAQLQTLRSRLADETKKPYAGQGNTSPMAVRLETDINNLLAQRDITRSGLNAAEQAGQRRLTQMGRMDDPPPKVRQTRSDGTTEDIIDPEWLARNPDGTPGIVIDGEVMPGYVFEVLLSMRHQQLRTLARQVEGAAPVYSDIAALDNASLGLPGFENTLITAANDWALGGLFTEARGVNRALYASLSEAPQVAVRRSLGYNVMSVIEPIPLAGPTARRIINVSREKAGQRFMHLNDVDQAFKQWQILIREMSRIKVFDVDGNLTTLLDEAIKKVRKDLKVSATTPTETADSLIGKWVAADLTARNATFFRYRDAFTAVLLEKIQTQALPGILHRNSVLRKSIWDEGLDPEGLLTKLKGSVRMQEQALRQAGNQNSTRVYGVGTGKSETALELNIAGPGGVSHRIVLEEIMPSQLPTTHIIPRYDQWENLLGGQIRTYINDLRIVNNGTDWFMSQWKKTVLIRPAWPMRVLSDDQLRGAAVIGAGPMLAGLGQGTKTYLIDLFRREGVDTMTPVIRNMREALTEVVDVVDDIGDLPPGFPEVGDAYIMVKGKALPVDEVSEIQLFDEWVARHGMDSLQELAREEMVTGRSLAGKKIGDPTALRQSLSPLTRTGRRNLSAAGLGALMFPMVPGAIAGSAAYSLYAMKVAKNAAIREVGEHFVFQFRDVSRLELAERVRDIRAQVAAGTRTVDEGVREIEDLRHATELLETQAATIEQVLELLNPETSAAVRETLTNFERVGMLMDDAGYQGYMMGGYGISNVFGDTPFEVNINKASISADAGRRRFVESAAEESKRALSGLAHGAPTYKVLTLADKGPRIFDREWNLTFNRQWVPAEVTDWSQASEFSRFTRQVWEPTTVEELVAWLEVRRGTPFEAAFRNKYENADNLRIWAEVAKGEADNLLPDLPEFADLRARAAVGEELSWAKDVAPIIARFADEAQPGISQRNYDAALNAGVREIREISGTNNFGKVVGRSALENDVGTSNVIQFVKNQIDQTMASLGTGVQDAMSRSPLWIALTREEMARRVQAYRNPDGSYTLNGVQKKQLELQSARAGLERTRGLLYDLTERTKLQEMVGHLMPFFGAYQEVASRWAGIAVKNPAFITRALHKYYLLTGRDDDGEEHILVANLPDSITEMFEKAGDLPGPAGVAMGGPRIFSVLSDKINMTFRPTSISMFTGGLPLGPGPTAIAGEVVARHPQLGDALEIIAPYGSSEARNRAMRLLENFEATIFKRLSGIAEGTPAGKKLSARIADDLAVEWYREDKPSQYETPEEGVAAFEAEVDFRRHAISVIHGIAALISPISVGFESPYQDITREFNEKTTVYGFDLAVMWLLEEHPELWGILARQTAISNGLASGTLEGEAAFQRHKDVAEKFPTLGPWIMGMTGAPDVVATWDRDVRTAEISQGRAYRPSPEEMLEQPDITLFYFHYGQLMDVVNTKLAQNIDPETGLPRSIYHSSNRAIQNGKRFGFRNEGTGERTPGLDQLQSDYPYGYQQFKSFDGTLRGDNITGFRVLADNYLEDFEYRPEMKWIAEHLEFRYEMELEMAARVLATGNTDFLRLSYPSGNDPRFPMGNLDLAQQWGAWSAHAHGNATFSATFDRYFADDNISFETWAEEIKDLLRGNDDE